jgi:ankyrin repeat protein
MAGDAASVRAQIAAGADIDAAEVDGSTALLWAAHQGEPEIVSTLLAAGADANTANTFGATPIREAVANGNPEVIGLLLDAGADPDSALPEGQTNLMVIARTANVEAARLLLDAGADVNATEISENQSALIWAADQAQGEMVTLLVAHGADVNARTDVHVNEVRVSAEPRVQYNPSGGLTPLIYAARSGCLACAKALVEGGADIDAYDPDGVTALITAVFNAHFDVAAYLVEAGADVNRWDWWGRTPLYLAVDYNTLPRGGRADRPSIDDTTSLKMIEILLEAGANPNAQLKFMPPFRNVGADRGADLLLSTGATPLLRAAKAGDVAAVELLLEAGARPDLAVARGWKDQVGGIDPLMAAAGLGWQLNDTRGQQKTQEQAIAVIELLLDAGADIDGQDERGRTALHGAVFAGYNDVARLLIERGADTRITDNEGLTALAIARDGYEVFRGQSISIDPQAADLIAGLTGAAASSP